MLKKLFFLLFCLATLSASGQIRFGFLSYQEVMSLMPEYKTAIQNLQNLKNKCNEEVKRSEDELVKKYAEFLQGQSEFPENILLKRQNELQNLINNGIMFRQETELLLRNAEKDMQVEVKEKLNQAIESVGQEQGLAFILNTDNNSCPFINKQMGVDITYQVQVKLGLIKPRTAPTPEAPRHNETLQPIDNSLNNTIHSTDSISNNEQ